MIQFTDRYGGRLPNWFTACFACEAMGCIPELCPGDPCPSPDEHVQPDFDGWHFLRCQACNRTGRVSWIVAVSRIPRWFVQGVRFFWMMSSPAYKPLDWTYGQHLWLVFKCAFVYDLLRLFR